MSDKNTSGKNCRRSHLNEHCMRLSKRVVSLLPFLFRYYLFLLSFSITDFAFCVIYLRVQFPTSSLSVYVHIRVTNIELNPREKETKRQKKGRETVELSKIVALRRINAYDKVKMKTHASMRKYVNIFYGSFICSDAHHSPLMHT